MVLFISIFIKAFYCALGFSFPSGDFENLTKFFMWISSRKKYLQNQGILVTYVTTSGTTL